MQDSPPQQLVLDGVFPTPPLIPREAFRLLDRYVIRELTHRSGRTTTSRVPRLLTDEEQEDAADAFDRSWLHARERPSGDEVTNSLYIADLFSGSGGLSLGVDEACRALGIRATFSLAIDTNPTALDVYRQNFRPAMTIDAPIETLLDGAIGDTPTSRELRLLDDVGPVNFVIAGPPCQGHSDLNNHSRRADPKNQLIVRVTRFVEIFAPDYVLIENVQGIRHDRLNSLDQARDGLRQLGYSLSELVLSAETVGVPQKRRRYFLFASRTIAHGFGDLPRPWATKPRSVRWAIRDLLDIEPSTVFDSPAVHSPTNRRRIDYLFDGDLLELPDSERPPCHAKGGHSYKAVYGRLRWDEPAPTVTTGFGSTGQGRFVHPERRRTLTPHEAARLQFFPDFFSFGTRGRRQYQELIGNAVPSRLAYAIAVHQLA